MQPFLSAEERFLLVFFFQWPKPEEFYPSYKICRLPLSFKPSIYVVYFVNDKSISRKKSHLTKFDVSWL